MERQRCRHRAPEPGPDTIYWLEMGSERGRSERQGGQEGSGGVYSGQPSGEPQRGEGQAGQSSAAATGRHGQREGGQESGSPRGGQAGGPVQGRDVGLEKGGTVRKGKERDRKGSRERDTGRQDAKEQAERGTGKRGKGAKGRGRRVAMGTWGHRCSQGRDWVGGEVSFRQPSRQSSHHFRNHLTLRWGWCTHPHQRTSACHRKHTCSSARRPVGLRGGRREGRKKSTGGHGRG